MQLKAIGKNKNEYTWKKEEKRGKIKANDVVKTTIHVRQFSIERTEEEMKEFVGTSRNGDLKEAVRGLSSPKLILYCVSEKDSFGKVVAELEQLYPGVPSMGCVGESYGEKVVLEKGILVTGFCGEIEAVTNVLTDVSTMPVKRIYQFEQDVNKIGGNSDNTVCIDFCSGNDECVLTTMETVLSKKKIQLTGGTAWEGLVAANGQVYEDSCVYALVRNLAGKVKVYKENLYLRTDKRYIVTKANPDKYVISELDGKPFQDVYTKECNVTADQIGTQTFVNPLGRVVGNETYIVSLKEDAGNKGYACFRKVNPKDVIYFLEIGDIDSIVTKTIRDIRGDFKHISGIFSINCLFRYLLFGQKNYRDTYFSNMASLGTHAGLIGLGEHYNGQHTNQTMSCVVFE